MTALLVLAFFLPGPPTSSDIPTEHDILRASDLDLEPVDASEPEPTSPTGGGDIAQLAAATGLSEDRVAAFLALADCETGLWVDGGAAFVEDSAVWSSTAGLYEGGLQFHPDTWDAYRDAGHPSSAAEASRGVEIVVADRVRAAQGWGAWPACSRKVGLR